MRQRLPSFLLLIGLLAVLVVVGALARQSAEAVFAQAPTAALSPPLFAAGQTYTFTWECTAITAGDKIGQVCMSEHLTVQAIRSDGWLLVTDQGGDGWTVNPLRAIGFKLAVKLERAAR